MPQPKGFVSLGTQSRTRTIPANAPRKPVQHGSIFLPQTSQVPVPDYLRLAGTPMIEQDSEVVAADCAIAGEIAYATRRGAG
jgi:hypothetical protein